MGWWVLIWVLLVILAGLGLHPPYPMGRHSLTPAALCLPELLPCPQDVEDGESPSNNKLVGSGFCKNNPGPARLRWGWTRAPRPRCGSPGLPQCRPHPLLLQDYLLSSPRGWGVGVVVVEGFLGLSARAQSSQWGLLQAVGAGFLSRPTGRRLSASTTRGGGRLRDALKP